MKQLQTLLIILTAALFFTACEKDESHNKWTISGEVSLKDAELESITSPLEGVNVYLLNAPLSMDTLSGFFAADDILEVTQTNAAGQYSFTDLVPGDYIVLPADTVNNFIFNWKESPDSIWMEASNTKSSYTINFSAPLTIPDNASKNCTFNLVVGELDPSEVLDSIYISVLDKLIYIESWDQLEMRVSQKTQKRYGCGWLGFGSCGWYWNTMTVGLINTPVSITDLLWDWWTYEYKDEYRIEFYWKVDGDVWNEDHTAHYIDDPHFLLHTEYHDLNGVNSSHNVSFEVYLKNDYTIEVSKVNN